MICVAMKNIDRNLKYTQESWIIMLISETSRDKNINTSSFTCDDINNPTHLSVN